MSSAVHVMTFPATRAGFDQAFWELRRTLDSRSLQQKTRYNCELVFEEVVSNITKYAYPADGRFGIEVSLDFSDRVIVMVFEDVGIPFDPVQHPPVENARSLEDATTGGRGLLLVRMAASRLDYQRTRDHRNRLTVTVKS